MALSTAEQMWMAHFRTPDDTCSTCEQQWPCDTSVLLTELAGVDATAKLLHVIGVISALS